MAKYSPFAPYVLFSSVLLLSACQVKDLATEAGNDSTSIPSSEVDVEASASNAIYLEKKVQRKAPVVSASSAVVAQCYEERFVIPPRGKNKKAPKFRFAEKWAALIDPATLGVALNERDVDCRLETENGQIHFTNPGKSRAVIDVKYCLLPEEPDDGDDGSAGGDDGSSGGDDGSTGGDDGSSGGDDGSTGGGDDGSTGGDDGSGSGDDGSGGDDVEGDGGAVVIEDGGTCNAFDCDGTGI